MDSEGSFVNEEIEAIIEFYEALRVESTPSRESKICEFVLEGLTMLFVCGVLSVGPWVRVIGKTSLYWQRLSFILKVITCLRRIIRDGKK